MTIDVLLAEKYDRTTNNCLHFAARAWELLTGDQRLRTAREGDKARMRGLLRQYRVVSGPTSTPSLVLMETRIGDEHMGVCYRRRLLHLDAAGAQFFPIEVAFLTHRNLRFYQCREY